MVSTTQLFTFLVVPFTALACEGECIVNITQEYLKLYSNPILHTFRNLAYRIDTKIVPPENRRQDPISYFHPVIKAFDRTSYNGLEHAIFPAHFHGKCLYPDGTVPHGCPNPDCPVVCGTPGSLVHFFPDLTRIVFNQVVGQLGNISSPGTKAFQQVEKAVLLDARKTQRRTIPRVTGFAKFQDRGTIEERFRAIVKDLPAAMRTVCGGPKLSECSWETYMKKFILEFP